MVESFESCKWKCQVHHDDHEDQAAWHAEIEEMAKAQCEPSCVTSWEVSVVFICMLQMFSSYPGSLKLLQNCHAVRFSSVRLVVFLLNAVRLALVVKGSLLRFAPCNAWTDSACQENQVWERQQPNQTTLSPDCGASAADICGGGGVPSWATTVTPFQLKGQGLIFAMAWQLPGAEMSIPCRSAWTQARNGQDTLWVPPPFFLVSGGWNMVGLCKCLCLGSAVLVVVSDKVDWLPQGCASGHVTAERLFGIKPSFSISLTFTCQCVVP